MYPFYTSSAPPGVGVPPSALSTGAGKTTYAAAWGSASFSDRSTQGRDRSEGFFAAASPAEGREDDRRRVHSSASASGTASEVPFATAPLSSFAAPARALAAAVANPLANHSRRCLLDSLASIVGKKLVFLDETLAGALALLVDSPTLQQQGVDRCFPLRSYPLHASTVASATAAASVVLFFCRPHLSLLPLIVHHINFIERTYTPTRPQATAAGSPRDDTPSAAGSGSGVYSSEAVSSRSWGVSRLTYSNSPESRVNAERDGISKTQNVYKERDIDRELTGPPLLNRFPLPTSFSPSGRHYFVVCIPEASDFFTTEFRRLLASGPVSPCPAAGTEAATAAAFAGAVPTPGLTPVASREPQQDHTSASGSAGVASSLFSNLSNLQANLFGGSGVPGFQTGGAPGSRRLNFFSPSDDAARLPPAPLSQCSATVTSCPLFFFPLAQDLLSLELPNSYRDLHLYGDKTPSQLAAAAIVLLQEELLHGGLIPQLRSLGSAAKAVADQLIRRRKERESQEAEQQQQQHLALYGPAAAGLFGKPGGFLAGAEGGGGGPTGQSYSAAAAAAASRAYLNQTGQGNPKFRGDAGFQAAAMPPGGHGDRSGKRTDAFTPPENSDYVDSQSVVEACRPLLPLAPPARFVLSRDDLTVDDEEEEEEEDKNSSRGERGRHAATPSNAQGSASAPTKSHGAGHYARDGRLSSTDRSEDGYSPRQVERDFETPNSHRSTRAPHCEYIPVDMLILIDRRSDLITPLCTAFTYEALLDAVFGIDAAAVDVPQQLLLQQPQQQQPTPAVAPPDSGSSGRSGSLLSFTPFFGGDETETKNTNRVVGVPVLLPAGPRRRISLVSDGLYALLRDLHQSAVGARLHSIASGIQQTYKEKDALRSIQEISVFISKFRVKQKEHSSLSLHVRLASFLAAVTQDAAFVQRLALEDELLQSGVSSSSSIPPLKSSIIAQFEALLEDAAAADRLWWAPVVAGVDAGPYAGSSGYNMQQRLQQVPGSSSAPMAAGRTGMGNEGSNRWRGTAAAGTGLVDFYRLLCLASLVNGGVRSKQIENIRAGLLQHFGFEEVQRLALLHRVGLLRQSGAGSTGSAGGSADKGGKSFSAAGVDAKGYGVLDGAARDDADGAASGGGLAPGTWKILKKDCNLLTDGTEGDEAMMASIAYACSGYAPLSVRLIELLFEHASGWRAIPHLLSLLWGPAMEVRQQPQPLTFTSPPLQSQPEAETGDVFATAGETTRGNGQSLQEQEAGGPAVAQEDITTVLVFYLGGVTHAEVAAIRRLNELELQRYHQRKLQSCGYSVPQGGDSTAKLRRFVILTTEITNAKKLIESCKVPAVDTCGRFRWSPCICSEDSI